MRPEIQEHLEKMRDTLYGKALKEYLDEEIAKLASVTNITENYAEEALARKRAVEILKKTFYFLNVKEIKKVDKDNYK